MALQTPLFTYQDARSRQQSVYNLRLTNWGNVGPTADSASLNFIIEDSVAGVAIAQTSDVDRCAIEYTPGKVFNAGEGQPTFFYACSVRAPVIFPVPGPIAIRASGALGGNTVSGQQDVLYRWGTLAFLNNDPTPDDFVISPVPRLDLIIYLKTPVLPPPSRAPKLYRLSTADPIFQGNGCIPCSGRRRIDIAVRPTGTATGVVATFGGISASWDSLNASGGIERPLGSTSALSAVVGDNARFVIEDLTTDFLRIVVGVGGGAGPTLLDVHMDD